MISEQVGDTNAGLQTYARVSTDGQSVDAQVRHASGPVGKLAKTLTFGLLFSVILSSAEAADQGDGRQLSRSWSKPGCLRSCLYARRGAMQPDCLAPSSKNGGHGRLSKFTADGFPLPRQCDFVTGI
jgi:hypothetical protein